VDDVSHEFPEGGGILFAEEPPPCGAEVWWAVLVDRGDEGKTGGP